MFPCKTKAMWLGPWLLFWSKEIYWKIFILYLLNLRSNRLSRTFTSRYTISFPIDVRQTFTSNTTYPGLPFGCVDFLHPALPLWGWCLVPLDLRWTFNISPLYTFVNRFFKVYFELFMNIFWTICDWIYITISTFSEHIFTLLKGLFNGISLPSKCTFS